MAQAIFNGAVIAKSDSIEIVDGNVYFPLDTLSREYFRDSDHTTVCGWKGTANYYSVEVEGVVAENAAWIYRATKPAAANIENHVAFYPVVTVER